MDRNSSFRILAKEIASMFNSPILLITFNRPAHTRCVLERILEAKPQELYVFQDGARAGNENDVQKCTEVRQTIEELWDNYISKVKEQNAPTIHRYYSDVNLGCGPGPAAAISWFFSQVERGIVMEDDCLANSDFFGYCEELLAKYQNDEQVQFINATLYHNHWHCEASYGFSHYMVTGAWAAWKRSWQGFDLDLHSLNARKFRCQVYSLTGNRAEADWWYYKVLEIQQDKEKKSYWDYQMQILLFLNNALTIHPVVNLISNIGFDAAGTHTLSNDGRGDKETFPILPLVHPKNKTVDLLLDATCFAKAYSTNWWHDIVSRLYRDMLYSKGLSHWLLMQYKRLKHKK